IQLGLMFEVTHSGHDKRHSALLGCGDNFRIAHGAAGLDCGDGTVVSTGDESIGEWEKSIACDDGAFQVESVMPGVLYRNANGFDAGSLSGTEAQSPGISIFQSAKRDRVRLQVLD